MGIFKAALMKHVIINPKLGEHNTKWPLNSDLKGISWVNLINSQTTELKGKMVLESYLIWDASSFHSPSSFSGPVQMITLHKSPPMKEKMWQTAWNKQSTTNRWGASAEEKNSRGRDPRLAEVDAFLSSQSSSSSQTAFWSSLKSDQANMQISPCELCLLPTPILI